MNKPGGEATSPPGFAFDLWLCYNPRTDSWLCQSLLGTGKKWHNLELQRGNSFVEGIPARVRR
jgi:hypothetical protein